MSHLEPQIPPPTVMGDIRRLVSWGRGWGAAQGRLRGGGLCRFSPPAGVARTAEPGVRGFGPRSEQQEGLRPPGCLQCVFLCPERRWGCEPESEPQALALFHPQGNLPGPGRRAQRRLPAGWEVGGPVGPRGAGVGAAAPQRVTAATAAPLRACVSMGTVLARDREVSPARTEPAAGGQWVWPKGGTGAGLRPARGQSGRAAGRLGSQVGVSVPVMSALVTAAKLPLSP